MPVDDHPVHIKTKIGANYRYGCNNGIRSTIGYYAPDRIYRNEGTFYVVQRFIENKMSRDCKYDMKNDPHCEGCKWKND